MNHPSKIQAFCGPQSWSAQWFDVRDEGSDSKPAEIAIYDRIGKDFWSGEGVGAKDFTVALEKIPADRAINIRINSPGGNVSDGLAIYNRLKDRRDKVTCYVDGEALSIASVIALAGHKTVMAPNALMMIHDPRCIVMGNADEMRKAAETLDKYKGTISKTYHEESGQPVADIESKMTEETWFTADEARDYGLCDEVSGQPAVFAAFDRSNFRRVPETLRGVAAPAKHQPPAAAAPSPAGAEKKDKIMNRAQILALLRSWGVEVNDSMTDEHLASLVQAGKPQPAPAATANDDLAKQVAELRQANAAERRMRLGTQIDALVADGRIEANSRDGWLNRAVADESIIAQLQQLPARQVQQPLGVEVVAEDVRSIITGYKEHDKPFAALSRGNVVAARDLSRASIARAMHFQKHASQILQVMNTNTVDTTLKRSVILQTAIFDFVRRIAPIRMFASVFGSVPLEGDDKVQVPLYDLDATASTSWDAGNGYVAGNTTTDNREISVTSRKYQAANFSSQELARQPFLNVQNLTRLKFEKLAYDVFADVLSVVTNANFGAAVKTEPASAFDSEDLADLKYECRTWPEMGRSLFLDSAYDANLLKDVGFKHALNAASDSVAKEGRLFPRVFGFDYIENPNIPGNSENLVGFAAFQSAILFAQAPIMPSEEVRRNGTIYDLVTDPQTGITVETRSFGDSQLDTATHVVECNYGFAKGNGNALKRITSA
ncbi:MAG: hypothetical protein E6Q97_16615 [Desulfurellales bacterium]|nr:MAG: hypothetical protein E6Q97_16615 [Desulfurellales bacterium]